MEKACLAELCGRYIAAKKWREGNERTNEPLTRRCVNLLLFSPLSLSLSLSLSIYLSLSLVCPDAAIM